MNDLTPDETEAILTLCLMAAFADGEKHEREREQLRKIADSFRDGPSGERQLGTCDSGIEDFAQLALLLSD